MPLRFSKVPLVLCCRWLLVATLWACMLPAASAVTSVHPFGVNVRATGATTVFLTFRGLDAGEVAQEAFWCGELQPALVAANPQLQAPFAVQASNPCVPGTVFGRLPLALDRAWPSSSAGNTNLTDIMAIPASVARRAWQDAQAGGRHEYVTGNNDADGAYLLQWVQQHLPRWTEPVRQRLIAWGGNSSGVNVANIDNLGNVHPDTMWWHHKLGNVKSRPFSAIWTDLSDPLMAGLKARPRPVHGRCGACQHLAICGGNTRVRAQQVTGDPWAEDPGCYLTDEEIGVEPSATRVETTAFQSKKRVINVAH